MLAFFIVFAFIRKYVAVASSVSLLLIIGAFVSLLSLRVLTLWYPKPEGPSEASSAKKSYPAAVPKRKLLTESYQTDKLPLPPHARI